MNTTKGFHKNGDDFYSSEVDHTDHKFCSEEYNVCLVEEPVAGLAVVDYHDDQENADPDFWPAMIQAIQLAVSTRLAQK